MQLAMICASAPALKAFFGKYLRDHFTKASRSNTYITQDSIPLKSQNSTFNATVASVVVRPTSGESAITAWPGLGNKDIMVEQRFSIQREDSSEDEIEMVRGAQHGRHGPVVELESQVRKERRIMGL
jgi:hypothetical protein